MVTTPAPQSPRRPGIAGIMARFIAYTALIGAGTAALTPAAARWGGALFEESSPLEWLQLGVMLTGALLLLLWGRRLASAEFNVLLAAFPALAVIREMDRYFDLWLPGMGWQLPFGIILALAAVYGWRRRSVILGQLPEFMSHRAFGMMWTGFVVAVIFSQGVGHGALMEAVFPDGYDRSIKRLIEEAGESFGYVTIVMGCVEWLVHQPRRERLPA